MDFLTRKLKEIDGGMTLPSQAAR